MRTRTEQKKQQTRPSVISSQHMILLKQGVWGCGQQCATVQPPNNMWEAASVLDGSAKRGLIGGVGLNLGCSLGTAGGSPDSVSRDKNNEEPDCNYPIGAPRNLNTQRDTKRGFRTNCSRCVDFTASNCDNNLRLSRLMWR